MKRFCFPLRPVAILRAHREMRAKEAFGLAIQALRQTEENLAATRSRMAQVEQHMRDGRQQTFSPAEEGHALSAYRRECTVEAAAEKAVENARTALQQRRLEYVEAHRKVEVVKRLEQKAREAYRLESGRAEQAEQDDFAGRSFSRRSNPTSA